MAFKKYARRSARRPRRRPTSFRRAAKKAVRTLRRKRTAKLIRSVTSRMAETKEITDIISNRLASISYLNTVDDGEISENVVYVRPGAFVGTLNLNIDEGTTATSRIGKSVTLTRLTMTMIMNPRGYDGVNNIVPRPTIVRMYFIKDKLFPFGVMTRDNIVFNGNPNAPGGILFRDEQPVAGTTGFYGTTMDMMFKLNNERYAYLKHYDFKLGHSNYNVAGQGGATSTTNQYFQNNDSKMFFKRTFDLTKHVNKKIKWDSAGNIISPGMIILFQVMSQTGESITRGEDPLNGTQRGVECRMSFNLKFKDM